MTEMKYRLTLFTDRRKFTLHDMALIYERILCEIGCNVEIKFAMKGSCTITFGDSYHIATVKVLMNRWLRYEENDIHRKAFIQDKDLQVIEV